MKEYSAEKIYNVAVLGHMGSGKTSLVESMLFLGKGIAKKGEVERKNTVSDYLAEEQSRQTSLSTSLIPVEWKGCKINFLDTPGSEEFIGEVDNDLSVVDGAIVILDATKGIEVGTERVWEALRDRNIPTLVLLNKCDKENVKPEQVIASVKEFSSKIVPVCLPLGAEANFKGYVDIVAKKAFAGSKEEAVPANLEGEVEETLMAIGEAVAETSEELLDKFFSGEELTADEIKGGLKAGVASCDIFPMLVSSAIKDLGVDKLLDSVIELLPNAAEKGTTKGLNTKSNADELRKISDSEPFSAFIFKTIIDPFLGTINFLRVNSGTTANVQEAYIPNNDGTCKIGQFITLAGKNQINVDVFHAGDICAVTKVPELATGYTICDRKYPIQYPSVELPTPVLYVAVVAKTKQDEDKISGALQKLNIEDPSFEIKRNPETTQLLIGGQGLTHIGYILEKMKNMFKVDVDISDPKIVYRETIRKVGSAQGRHKKQSGGAGQFGDVWIRFEPTEAPFEFASEVVGGSVPKNYFPAVEKGLQDCLEHGPLAGFPVIGVRAVLYDGSYHPVDSNEISFKIAASLAFKNAVPAIKPTILEPIMEVKVVVKADYVGDVMGDMNKRRGSVLGIDPLPNGRQQITATVPESEITKYATDLKAMTQGSGHFSRKFVRYAEVPEYLIDKIVAEYKKEN